jgi:Tfp pilus assembly protein PilF
MTTAEPVFATVRRRALAATGLTLLVWAAGCTTAPPPPPTGLSELMERKAERSLVEGIRAYDNGQYAVAETALKQALDAKLVSRRDQASAHKLLAFIACTSGRTAECEASFRAARTADPGFALSRAEAGHPMWGPVYQRVLGSP